MRIFPIITLSLALLPQAMAAEAQSHPCPAPWVCEMNSVMTTSGITPSLRMGYYPEDQGQPFAGNVIYFEGLGDSMVNHAPLFQKLSQVGYRVIAFDYFGQGGSEGSMNRTRIQGIIEIGAQVWSRYARVTLPRTRHTILGWSTGGLAAFVAAHQNATDRVILIAPGLAPRVSVGSGILSLPPNQITLESLTSAQYSARNPNPHLEPISPQSPLSVPLFSLNLMGTAKQMKGQSISPRIPVLAILSGKHDTYVNAAKTRARLARAAPHREEIVFEFGKHELDNESGEISDQVSDSVIEFLNRTH
ncbi:MAG: alpha/beta fold hydrolase [Proteobacteria bacterium]|nr:MAG: alpha/beta fold hydrolase [Pseudomonadota bacterium]